MKLKVVCTFDAHVKRIGKVDQDDKPMFRAWVDVDGCTRLNAIAESKEGALRALEREIQKYMKAIRRSGCERAVRDE